MVRLITISRSYGSGGAELGRHLAERLGWRLIDRDLVHEVANRLRVPEEEVERRGEHVASLVERVGAYLADAFPEMMMPPIPPPRVDYATVRILAESILIEAARTPDLVIVGFGGQHLFRNREDALHIRVYAPVSSRVATVMARLGVNEEQALREIRRRDHERSNYLRRHYEIDWMDPMLYDLMINTSRIPVPEAAELVATRASGK